MPFSLTPGPVVLALAAAYLCGAIPFSLLLGWTKGVDLRTQGSGNPGATNVARVLGWRWGALALLCDSLKGLAAAAIVPGLCAGPGVRHLAVGCGAMAILGHMFPCWLKFQGGKGVATSLGVVAWLTPWGALAALLVFVVCFAATRIVSLSSLLAAGTFAAVQLWLLWPLSVDQGSLIALSVAAPALVIVRHRANIVRLWRGEERKLQAGRPTH